MIEKLFGIRCFVLYFVLVYLVLSSIYFSCKIRKIEMYMRNVGRRRRRRRRQEQYAGHSGHDAHDENDEAQDDNFGSWFWSINTREQGKNGKSGRNGRRDSRLKSANPKSEQKGKRGEHVHETSEKQGR